MSLKVPNQGEQVLIGWIRDRLIAEGMIHLYKAVHVPADVDQVADYEESSFPGYSAQTLDTWLNVALTFEGVAQIVGDVAVFTATDASEEQVFGYFVTDGDDNLLWAEQLPAPVDVGAPGNKVNIVPQFSFHSEF